MSNTLSSGVTDFEIIQGNVCYDYNNIMNIFLTIIYNINKTRCYLRGRNMDANSTRRKCTENVREKHYTQNVQTTEGK
jgi:hypothetical protein